MIHLILILAYWATCGPEWRPTQDLRRAVAAHNHSKRGTGHWSL